jgi:hypothetical protein
MSTHRARGRFARVQARHSGMRRLLTKRRGALIGGVAALFAVVAIPPYVAGTGADGVLLGEELVRNGHFDLGTEGWRTNDKHWQRLDVSAGADPHAVIWSENRRNAVLNDLENTVGAAEQDSRYFVSARVRAVGAPISGQLRVREVSDGKVRSHQATFYLTSSDWTKVELDVSTSKPDAQLDLNVLGWVRGPEQQLLIDDISMRLVELPDVPRPSPSPTPTVTSSPTSTPTPTTTPTTTSTATTTATTTTPAVTTTTATTIPPTTTAATPPVATCATSGAVPIGVGDDAQRVVSAHGVGTTYLVKAGIHERNFSVQPKSGDTFCGEPGAVLDGGRSLATAFSGGASDVTLDSITVRDYNPGRQGAAIWPQSHASGWVVRNVSALHNGWAGLLVADGMKILGGHYTDNDQLGIGGNAATGIVLDGLDGDPSTFDGPELARNHTLHASCEWEAGGMKWDVGQVTVRNAYVHDNDCRGLWADINARGALIEHNLVEHNLAEGIFYEISQDAVIRYNQVYRNGVRAAGWYWDGGITVASSFNVEVYGNRLSGNYNGITGTQQDRPDSTPPAHLLDNLRVHDNLICATAGGHPTGVVADNGANLAARNITFTSNTIQSAGCQ